ncbi:benzoate/H(+) symporter BenE family transporter [Acinetobacter sp. MB5]|uniref:benzoate/H(+) symporter BenE family transporter n=1 Tax=Acinetobacter sp. MB5 TaxID=2069438 RepID=UPI000DCF7A7F|nr:benzoate/H(+) symporter BenE family transporter [Acinetobacter sp. MB5]
MLSLLQQLKRDWSISATIAGFLAVLISYSGPLIIFFQAAQHAQVDAHMLSSWIWGISIGAAVSGIFLSIRYKVPIITAWSAPGTALLVTLFPHISLNEVVAAYITAAVVMLIIGVSGSFDTLLRWIPSGIAAGMMAGILFQFGLGVFQASNHMPLIIFIMLVVYLCAKRFNPRYSMLWVLSTGIVLSLFWGQLRPVSLNFALTIPEWISPHWTWSSTLNFALPLILVSLSGQFLPGMALFKLNDYQVSGRTIIGTTSLVSLFVAFTGGISIVLASITASLCMGEDCHENPKRRYIAGITNGLFYLLGGLFSGSIVLLFSLFPKELVAALAGLALISAITYNLNIALSNEQQRESAVITFLASVSGMHFLGLSSVFWGICIGMLAHLILSFKPNRSVENENQT